MTEDPAKPATHDALAALIASAASRAAASAAVAAASIEEPDQKTPPTTLRLRKRTVHYFDVLSAALGISRNSAIELALDGLVRKAGTGVADDAT